MNLGFLETLVTQWPTDWVILGTFAVIVALDAVRSGSNRACALSLTFPLALLTLGTISQTVFVTSFAEQLLTPLASAALFGGALLLLYVFMRRIIGFWTDSRQGALQALIAGVACTAIVVVVWLQVPALDTIWHFSNTVHATFGQSYRLWWYLGSFAALAYVRS